MLGNSDVKERPGGAHVRHLRSCGGRIHPVRGSKLRKPQHSRLCPQVSHAVCTPPKISSVNATAWYERNFPKSFATSSLLSGRRGMKRARHLSTLRGDRRHAVRAFVGQSVCSTSARRRGRGPFAAA